MTEEHIDRLLAVRRAMQPEIIPDKAALLIIDMQEYQVRKAWPLFKFMNDLVPGLLDYYAERVEKVAEPNIIKLIEACRSKGVRIVYTMFSSFNKDGSDLTRQIRAVNEAARRNFEDVMFPHKDHPGSKIIDSLKPGDEDLVMVKNTSGVFAATDLDFYLKNMGVEQLLVVGVVTNMCVEGAARTGSELGFDVILVDDACAAWSEEVHGNTLRSFGMIFGSVMTTEQVIEKIK